MQCVENLLQNTDAIASTPKAFFASGAISARYAAGFTAFLFLDERCCPKKFRITKRIYPGLVQTTPSKCLFEIAADLYLPHKWHRQHDLAFAYMALRAHLALLLLHMAYADKPYR